MPKYEVMGLLRIQKKGGGLFASLIGLFWVGNLAKEIQEEGLLKYEIMGL